MSKTSWFYVCAMIAIIVSTGAINGYRAYKEYKARQQEEQQSEFTFQNVPVTLGAPVAQAASKPVPYIPLAQDEVFFGEKPLSPAQEAQQAGLTLESILADYKNEPALQAFNQELSQLTQGQATGLQDLSGPRLGVLMQQYPQVGELIKKHLQNPEFAFLVGQIFANPQYVQSVEVLQGQPAVLDEAAKE